MTFKELEQYWYNELSAKYDDRETLNLFYWTLEDTSNLSRVDFLSRRMEEVPTGVNSSVKMVLQELKKGVPYQYIVGHTYFGELKIKTSPAALIPRPETEELVHWIFECYPISAAITIEDFCTGTGCIALSLKNRLTKSKVIASDVSEDALDLAQENASALNISIEVCKEDVLNPQQLFPLDVIVANPPYIPNKEREEMLDHVLDYEPGLALFVPDEDPLLFYRKIAEIGMQRLRQGGNVFFELHENFSIETKEMMEKLGYKQVELRQDLQEKWRMLRAIKA